MDDIRLDKYLWAVRVFKTRSDAADAIRTNKVTVNGSFAKPSREVKIGDLIAVRKRQVTYSYKVLGLVSSRQGARNVPDYCLDVTPPGGAGEARRAARDDLRLPPTAVRAAPQEGAARAGYAHGRSILRRRGGRVAGPASRPRGRFLAFRAECASRRGCFSCFLGAFRRVFSPLSGVRFFRTCSPVGFRPHFRKKDGLLRSPSFG